ncbi:MAG: hypothetical protein BGO98_05815 [Myxococcales bacterium 68-20]|nr:hypothetical protein [Myxococcales bacterium]OJY28587.1 MAG: hypothetical protein BGO98_05815 [Myxococcales bacterium 68-20]
MARAVQSCAGAMATNEGTSTMQTANRPTRAAVVLTLAMTAFPLLPLLVSAAGCSRSTAHAAVEVRANESAAAPSDASSVKTNADRSSQ